MDLAEIIPDAAFFVSRETGMAYDAACDLCRAEAAVALDQGIEFNAEMLADVILDMAAA